MQIAVIPARGGSKRVPRKNIRDFAGKPIIAWPIEVALSCGLFDKVVVSTDDEEIASIAKKLGASVPFMRPENLSDDFADTKSVVNHTISELGLETDLTSQICCIYPTSAFVTADQLGKGLTKIISGKHSFVFSVTSVGSVAFRSFTQDQDGRLKMLFPENYSKRSQELPEIYCDAAQFYWGSVKSWLSNEKVFSENSRGIFIEPNSVQDIDTQEHWIRAEQIFNDLKVRNTY